MVEIKFCKAKCCPTVKINNNDVYISEDKTYNGYGGSIRMHKESFKDFVDACKEGKFDYLL